jgi:hypothetical protein
VPRGPSPRLPPAAQPAHGGIAVFLTRPATFVSRATLVTVNLAAITFFLLSYTRHGVGFGPYHIDLDVYRIGAQVWRRGGNLYGPLPATRAGVRLPFTYPPVAAILLAPFALVPFTAAATVLTLATIALLAMVLRAFLRRLAGPAAGSPWALAWLLPPALFLEPARDTLSFGQINVVLMTLVTLDCLAETPRWPRGALTGLAAAVKLTPAAFVLFFLLRRDYRAAAWAGLSFAAATAVGFAAAWHDSVHYWTRTVYQPGWAGNPASASNQCIVAFLARAGRLPGHRKRPEWPSAGGGRFAPGAARPRPPARAWAPPVVLAPATVSAQPDKQTISAALTVTECPARNNSKEFVVLEVLMRAEGAVVSAEQLLEKAWDENADPFTNAVRVAVMTLRRKLGQPPVIETVPGAGYRVGP